MLIPLRHENMEGRRWPVISIALVLLNLSIFLATRGQIDTENPRRAEVRAHLLLLAAMHPELSQPPHVEALVTKFRTENPGTWKEAQSQSRDVADAWDARIRLMEDQGRSLSNLALGKGIRFKAASYWLLPIWLLMEIFSGAIFGQHSGVAHWAHVGGFLFGAVVALGLRYSGLEQKANAAIEAKVTWTADPLLVQAIEQMEHGKLDEAIASLKALVAAKPDSVEGYTLLSQVH